MKNFKKLSVWNKSMSLAKACLSFISENQKPKYFALNNQISRSAISIPSNIAEGSSRKSTKEYFRYLEIALGSAFELETQLLLLENSHSNSDEVKGLLLDFVEVQKMLSGLMTALKSELRAKKRVR